MIANCAKIKDTVASLGMDQKSFAKRSGVSVTTISQIFSSDLWPMRTSTCGKICSALGLKPSDIEMSRDELAIRYAVLSKKHQELKAGGLNEAADIIKIELEIIEKFLA